MLFIHDQTLYQYTVQCYKSTVNFLLISHKSHLKAHLWGCTGKIWVSFWELKVGFMFICCHSSAVFNIILYWTTQLYIWKSVPQFATVGNHLNSLRPSDAIWRHRSGSTLAQVMACCLMEPSHYLNQYWLIITNIQFHSSDGNFTRDTSAINE